MPDQSDLFVIQKEILVALRGRRSQGALSRLLGYSFNQVYRWEAGLTDLHWDEFMHIADKCGRCPADVLARYLKLERPASDGSALIAAILGNRKSGEVAEQLGISRYRVSRWLSGATKPSFLEVFQLARAYLPSHLELLRDLAHPRTLPSVEKLLEKCREQQELSFRYPWAGALRELLEIAARIGLPAEALQTWAAGRLGLAPEDLAESLASFRSHGFLRTTSVGTIVTDFTHMYLSKDFRGIALVRHYWAQRAADFLARLTRQPERSLHGYLTFRASPATFRKVVSLYLTFYSDLWNLVQEAQKEGATDESVYVMNLAIMDPSEEPA